MGRVRPDGGNSLMILGILAQQIGAGGGDPGGTAARYWRMYFTGQTNAVRFIGAGQVNMAETVGGIGLIGAGTPSASSERGAFYEAFRSFDGSLSDHWNSAADSQLGGWLQYDFGSGVSVDVNEISIIGARGGSENLQMFSSALVQSSSDGSAWSTQWVIEPQSVWALEEPRTFNSSGGLPVLFVSDSRFQNQTTATTGTTFSGVNFGPERAGRLIAVSVAAQRQAPISSMTIGGVAATRAVRSRDAASFNPISEIWYAVATGAGGDIIITHGASETGRIRATAWNISGVSDPAPVATDRYDTGAAGDMTIAAPSGSVVIAAPAGGSSSNLSGLAQTFIHEFGNTNSNGLAQEIVTTAATKTITASANTARVAVCWAT